MNHELYTDTYVIYSEAKEEAERLSRVLQRDIEAARTDCDCDYDRMCGKCGGEGTYYELRERPLVLKTEFAPVLSCREMEIDRAEKEWEAANV